MPDIKPQETLGTNAPDFRLNRFEDAWRTGDSTPDWRQHLPIDGEPCSPQLIFDLLQMDIECRVKAGRPALLGEPYFEHPRLQREDAHLDSERQVELIRCEYQQRWNQFDPVSRSKYESAFPQHAEALRDLKPTSQCPRCHKILVLDETMQTVVCPACSSNLAIIHGGLPPFTAETLPADAALPELDLRRYELSEELGKGGMGEVYRCGDPALGRDLAIKIMKADYRGNAKAERRFLREARLTASLQHPGIVPVYNLGRLSDGRLHYTMRLVRGETFAGILKDQAGKAESLPSLLSIFEKICQAVAYAHSKRVIHRDLKPSNVMVGKFGEVQVMDWGLAKLLAPDGAADEAEETTDRTGTRIFTESADTPVDLSRTGDAFGTLAYMPTEQARGKWDAVDERADVFALGSILCEILTGQPAYAGTGKDLLDRVERGDVSDALQRLHQCSADAALTALCRECLSPSREDRPRDAAVVAKRVDEYQAEVQERLRQAELERVAAETRAREEQARTLVEQERAREALGRVKAEQQAKLRLLALSLAIGAILCLGIGGGWWIAQERAARDKEAIARLEADARANEAGNHYLHGEVLYNKDRLNEAITEYRKAIELKLDDVKYWTSLAEVLYQQKRWDEAISAYETVIRLKPDYAVAYHHLGDALDEKGQTDRAITAYKEAIRLEPEYAKAHDDLGDSLLRKGRLDEAIAEYRKAIRLNPDYADPHNGLGLALKGKGLIDEAIIELRKSKQLQPNDPNFRDNLGDALRKKGQLDEAIAEYRQAIQLKPEEANYHNALGVALEEQDRKDEAIDEFREASRLNTKEPIFHDNLGDCLRKKGRLDEAMAEYRQAIALDPKYARAHNSLGNVLHDKGEVDAAIAEYREAIHLKLDDAIIHTNLGNTLRKKGQLDEAMAEYHKAIQLKRDYADAHNELGVTLDVKGHVDEVIAEYREAIRLKPDEAVYHTNLGNRLYAKGQADEAIAEYREAICLKHDYTWAHIGLGNTLRRKSQLDEAIASYREAIHHKPDYAYAHSGMGLVLLQQGCYAEARKSFQRAVELFPKDDLNRSVYIQYLQDGDRFPGLEKKLPVILSGQELPANADEALALATTCRFQQRRCAAARLYAAAFDAEPRLAADLKQQHRCNAAYCAALAAAGQGEDARLLPDKAVVMFRRWALNWLRDDLKAYSLHSGQDNPAVKQEIQQNLLRWRRDPDLASVREPQALDRLPDNERAAWQALWRDVDELSKRVAKQDAAKK